MLVKNAEALKLAERIDTLVVDKTGTLTVGKPKLVKVHPAEGFEENEVLRLSAALERGSEHPLAAAIVEGAQDRGIVLPESADFASVTGKGVTGQVDGRRVALGNAALLETVGADISPLESQADQHRSEGEGVMFVAIAGAMAGPHPRKRRSQGTRAGPGGGIEGQGTAARLDAQIARAPGCRVSRRSKVRLPHPRRPRGHRVMSAYRDKRGKAPRAVDRH